MYDCRLLILYGIFSLDEINKLEVEENHYIVGYSLDWLEKIECFIHLNERCTIIDNDQDIMRPGRTRYYNTTTAYSLRRRQITNWKDITSKTWKGYRVLNGYSSRQH